jgi:hypothetical protein
MGYNFAQGLGELRGAVDQYEPSRIKTRVDHALAKTDPRIVAQTQPSHIQRYLGEVSDLRFFSLVERVLQTQDRPADVDLEFDSYEQDCNMMDSDVVGGKAVDPPSLDAAQPFIDVYFSTIHFPYPFVPQSVFRKTYRKVQDSRNEKRRLGSTRLALICQQMPPALIL